MGIAHQEPSQGHVVINVLVIKRECQGAYDPAPMEFLLT